MIQNGLLIIAVISSNAIIIVVKDLIPLVATGLIHVNKKDMHALKIGAERFLRMSLATLLTPVDLIRNAMNIDAKKYLKMYVIGSMSVKRT